MKLINQKTYNTGCGIAAFAMIGNFNSFEDAEAWMKKENVTKDNGFVTIYQMRNAIQKRTGYKTTLHNCYLKATEYAVFLVKSETQEHERHWIVKFNNEYYDPLPDSDKPKSRLPYEVTRVVNIHR